MTDAVAAFNALDEAIEQERIALLGTDIDKLSQATEAKLAAVKAIESVSFGEDMHERLALLAEKHRKNAALLMRRRQGVRWALNYLGCEDGDGTYGPNGTRRTTAPSRLLAQG